MEIFYIVLLTIYGLSFICNMINIVEASNYSQVAKSLGKDSYIFNGIFVSLIPIINTLCGGHWFYRRVIKGDTAKVYHYDEDDDFWSEKNQTEREERRNRFSSHTTRDYFTQKDKEDGVRN